MDVTLGYAIAAGGVLFVFVLINLLPCLPNLMSFTPPFFYRAFRYLTYPYLVRRHRFWGPWTLADVLTQLVYIGGNSVCLGLGLPGLAKAGMRAANLSLINLIPLFLGPHLSFLADILGVSLSTFRHIHRSAGLMSSGLVLFHSLIVIISHAAFTLRSAKNLSAAVAASSLGLIVVLSWPPLRRRFYELFLRLHQALAAIIAISALLHVPSTLFPRMYFYITLGIFGLTSLAEGGLLLRHGITFKSSKEKKRTRVGEIFKYPGDDDKSPVQVTILPKEPLEMEVGQYINICIPSLSLGLLSSMQSHPFVVASWTGKLQTKLELVIQPRRGWTKKLHSRAITVSGQGGGLGGVFFTGPHGASIPVDEYEYVFMIASGYGIVAHLPLLERLVQGTLAREVRARRIRLVWEFEDIGLYKAVYPLLNWVLGEDRRLGNNCTLAISLYSVKLAPDELSQRAQILKPPMSVKEVFDTEVAELEKRELQENKAVEAMEQKRAEEKEKGRTEIMEELEEEEEGRTETIELEEIRRERREIIREPKKAVFPETLPVCTRTPRMLVTVSASTKYRDELRSGLRTSLNKEITLVELDYQPSD